MSFPNPRKYDLVIYGATGFTGQIAAQYVQDHYPNLKFALAGRNGTKLETVRSQIGASDDLPIIVADAVNDPESLKGMVSSTKVLANYAGTPFIDKALPVVAACVEAGTCYTDITGEVPFQRASYDRYNEDARKNKSLIIHACGFDSIPSDIGSMMAATAMKERHGCECSSIETVAASLKGGLSGGTLATMMALLFSDGNLPGMKEAKARGSYALDPDGGTGGPDTSDSVRFVSYSPISQRVVIPFVMAVANAPVVRKSNALMGYRYGKNCSYKENYAVPNYAVGFAAMLGMGFLGILIAFPPTRWCLNKFVFPKPGQGPSKELQDSGFFDFRCFAVGDKEGSPVVEAFIKSGNAGDGGYKATARMSIEASLCMALEREKCLAEGGVLTPASALGTTLVDRLNKSGMELGLTPATSG